MLSQWNPRGRSLWTWSHDTIGAADESPNAAIAGVYGYPKPSDKPTPVWFRRWRPRGDDYRGAPLLQKVYEEFKEAGNNYFESEPIFDTSDIEEDNDRLDLGPKFDLSDDEDEDEFDEQEQTKIFRSCLDFVLRDEEGDVPLFMVQHVYRDPYLFDEDLSHKEVVEFFSIEFEANEVLLFAQFQVLEGWINIILHSYHLRLLQIRGWIFYTLEGMMQGRKRTITRGKVGLSGLGNSRQIYANQADFCESR